MAEKLEDLNLPGATVARIIKEALPDQVAVGKDARAALSRAASVFVLFLTSQASQEAQREKRKTLLGQDVIKALEELEFDDFIEPLQAVLKGIFFYIIGDTFELYIYFNQSIIFISNNTCLKHIIIGQF